MPHKVYMNYIYPSSLLRQLAELWRTEQLCDAVITVDKVIVAKAHKLVLFAVSPKLKADTCTRNASHGSFLNVTLPSGISSKAVNAFLQYLYEGYLVLVDSLVNDLLRIAKFLKIRCLHKCCKDFWRTFSDSIVVKDDSDDLGIVDECCHIRNTQVDLSKRLNQRTDINDLLANKIKQQKIHENDVPTISPIVINDDFNDKQDVSSASQRRLIPLQSIKNSNSGKNSRDTAKRNLDWHLSQRPPPPLRQMSSKPTGTNTQNEQLGEERKQIMSDMDLDWSEDNVDEVGRPVMDMEDGNLSVEEGEGEDDEASPLENNEIDNGNSQDGSPAGLDGRVTDPDDEENSSVPQFEVLKAEQSEGSNLYANRTTSPDLSKVKLEPQDDDAYDIADGQESILGQPKQLDADDSYQDQLLKPMWYYPDIGTVQSVFPSMSDSEVNEPTAPKRDYPVKSSSRRKQTPKRNRPIWQSSTSMEPTMVIQNNFESPQSVTTSPSGTPGISETPVYTCQMCGKTYLLRSSLRRHQKQHSQEWAFECDVCGKKFTRKDHWTSHSRVHKRMSANLNELRAVAKDGPDKELQYTSILY